LVADADNKMSDVLVDGVSVGAVGTYNFSGVIVNHTLAVIFEASEGTYTTVDGNGDVTKKIPVSSGDSTGTVSRTTSSDGSVTISATQTDNGSSVRMTVAVDSTSSGDVSEASVDDTVMAEALRQAQTALSNVSDEGSAMVTVSVDSGASSLTAVTLGSDSLSSLAEAGAEVEIATGTGIIAVGSDVLSNLQGGSLTLSTGEVDPSALTDAQREAVAVSGGTMTVTVPYTLKDGEDPEDIQIFYLKDDGTTETFAAVYDAVSGTVSFQTDHFRTMSSPSMQTAAAITRPCTSSQGSSSC